MRTSLINKKVAKELTNGILHHSGGERGTTTSIVGKPGTGKTSLLYFIAQASFYFGQDNWHPETVVVRGRPLDLWFSLIQPDYSWYDGQVPEKPVKIWFHENDHPVFHSGTTEVFLDPSIVGYYKDVPDLYDKMVRGGINIVYEDQTYSLSPEVQRIILSKAFLKESTFEDVTEHDPAVFWFEFLAYAVYVHGDQEYFTIIIDECDDVFPSNAPQLRYHLQQWLKNTVRDLRKCKISLVFACHNSDDVDHRVFKKCMYRIWMPNSMMTGDSLTPVDHTLWLPKGTYCITHGQWGDATFPKLKPYRQITVTFTGDLLVASWTSKVRKKGGARS